MTPVIGIIASSISGHLTPPYDPSGYDALATVTLSSTASSITFAGIPSGYAHLEIRMLAGYTGSVGAGYVSFNDDTSSGLYSTHAINGDGGSTPGALAYTSQNRGYFTAFAGTSPAARNTMVMSILDYDSTTKFKTTKSIYGWDNNGSGYIEVTSNNWRNLSPITAITLTPANTFDSYTNVALFGVK